MVERGRKIHEEKRGETSGGKEERGLFTGVPSLSPPTPPLFTRFPRVQFNLLPNDLRALISERLKQAR